MSEALDMGKYAAYVWSAYGISAVVLIGSVIVPIMQNKAMRLRIRQIQQEQD